MLDSIHSSKHDSSSSSSSQVHIKLQPGSQPRASFSSVEVMVLPPPPSSLLASADGLKMQPLAARVSKKRDWRRRAPREEAEGGKAEAEPCRCHESVERYLQQQSQAAPVSGTCASVDELAESDMDGLNWSLAGLSTCGAATCLVLHCLGFKPAGQAWPAPAAPLHVAPSRVNPSFLASEEAHRARLAAVQEAQGGAGRGSHVQVSDVTPALLDQLKSHWDHDSE